MEREEYNVYSFEGLNDTLLDFANEMRFGGDLNVTFKFVEATKSDLLSLYNSNAICWEGINLKKRVPKKEEIGFIEFITDNNLSFKENIVYIYIARAKLVNKVFNLKTKYYKDNVVISLISLNSIKLKNGFCIDNKNNLHCRWWTDVVDNNEYYEYTHGNHKYSENIQWLIDAKEICKEEENNE